jgi:hypothetical protein
MMNDLIGLQYEWGASPDDGNGKSDCFQLSCAIRRRLGLKDYGPTFAWAYNEYKEDSFSARMLLRWLRDYCNPIEFPQEGDIGMSIDKAALITIACHRLFCIAPMGRSVSIEYSEGALSCAYWFSPK